MNHPRSGIQPRRLRPLARATRSLASALLLLAPSILASSCSGDDAGGADAAAGSLDDARCRLGKVDPETGERFVSFDSGDTIPLVGSGQADLIIELAVSVRDADRPDIELVVEVDGSRRSSRFSSKRDDGFACSADDGWCTKLPVFLETLSLVDDPEDLRDLPVTATLTVSDRGTPFCRARYSAGLRRLDAGDGLAQDAGLAGQDAGVMVTSDAGTDTPAQGVVWDTPFDATDVGWLLSVWGPRDDLHFAVGGAPEQGVIMRVEIGEDGDQWTEMELPEGTPGLNWVFGFAEDDVWSVGRGGTILHFDGTRWQSQDSPVVRELWGVWGATPDALWAVGGSGAEEGQATLLRFADGAWSQQTLPVFERERVWALFKVWGTSADNVYVVGQSGAVLHYDGSDWTELQVGADRDLIALWGTGPDRIVMVGGRAAAQLVTWDGESWRGGQLSGLLGLNGVWMRDPDTIHVAGLENTLATIDFDSLKITKEAAQPTMRMDFHAVFGGPDGSAAGRLTAVGGTLKSTSGPYLGLVRSRALGADE